MKRYVPIETPGGTIWAEVEETDEVKGLQLVGIRDEALKSFQEAAGAMRDNAKFLLRILEELSPQEMEVSFGIKVGVEGGTPFFGLAKASGEGSYTVKLKWKSDETD
jgi:hypothetical protein